MQPISNIEATTLRGSTASQTNVTNRGIGVHYFSRQTLKMLL